MNECFLCMDHFIHPHTGRRGKIINSRKPAWEWKIPCLLKTRFQREKLGRRRRAVTLGDVQSSSAALAIHRVHTQFHISCRGKNRRGRDSDHTITRMQFWSEHHSSARECTYFLCMLFADVLNFCLKVADDSQTLTLKQKRLLRGFKHFGLRQALRERLCL